MEAISVSLNTISERGVYTHTSLAYLAICQSRKDPGIRVSNHDSHPSLSEHPQVLESIFPLSFTQQGTYSQPYPPTDIPAPGATIRTPFQLPHTTPLIFAEGFFYHCPVPPHFSCIHATPFLGTVLSGVGSGRSGSPRTTARQPWPSFCSASSHI